MVQIIQNPFKPFKSFRHFLISIQVLLPYTLDVTLLVKLTI